MTVHKRFHLRLKPEIAGTERRHPVNVEPLFDKAGFNFPLFLQVECVIGSPVIHLGRY